MNHPAHFSNADNSLSPSAFIPFCAFKANLAIAKSTTMHPNLSFPVCSSFVPDILEGQLCYTLRINETGGKGKQNGLMLLLDLNENRDFHTSLHHHASVDDKYRMNLDTENSMHDTSAKIQINAMLPDTKFGPGSYKMTSVKEMIATDDFIGMSSQIRNCEIESYDECRTRNLLAHCRCVPWELHNMRVIVRLIIFTNLQQHIFNLSGRYCLQFNRTKLHRRRNKGDLWLQDVLRRVPR